jgi:hypothetical protein
MTMQESNQTSGPDTAAELTRLAGWISEQLGDETADRQWIAESAAAKVRDITLQMLGAAELEQRRAGAELAARRTAAAAARGDFEREWHNYSMQGGAEPAWQVWAQRLSESVASLLDAPAEARLALHQPVVLVQALADAIEYRTPGADCADCDASPAGLCQDHAEDLDKTDAYLALARVLGIEAER